MKSSALQDRRVWLVGGAVSALLIIVVSWLFVIHPKMAASSQLRSQAVDNDLQNSTLQTKIDELADQNTHIGEMRRKLRAALAQLPSSSELPEFTRELTAAAARSSVDLSNITVGAQSAVAAAVAPTTPADGTSTAGTPTGSATDPATAPVAASQYLIPVTLLTTGAVNDQIAFVHALQHGTRSVLLTSTQLSESTTTTMTVQLDIFTAPVDAATRTKLAALLHAGN